MAFVDEDVLGQDPELGRRLRRHLGRDVNISAEQAAGRVQLDLHDIAPERGKPARAQRTAAPPARRASTASVWSTGGIPRKVGGVTSTAAMFGQPLKTDSPIRVSPGWRVIWVSPEHP